MADYRRGATTLFRNQARAYRFFSIIPCVKKESNRRALSARRLLLWCGAAIIQSRI